MSAKIFAFRSPDESLRFACHRTATEARQRASLLSARDGLAHGEAASAARRGVEAGAASPWRNPILYGDEHTAVDVIKAIINHEWPEIERLISDDDQPA